MTDIEFNQLIHKLPRAFLPDKAGSTDAVVLFQISGENGGDWGVVIKNQKCEVVDGMVENPRLTVKSDAKTVAGIFAGTVDASAAFFQGKIQMLGDMGLALRLSGMFKIT